MQITEIEIDDKAYEVIQDNTHKPTNATLVLAEEAQGQHMKVLFDGSYEQFKANRNSKHIHMVNNTGYLIKGGHNYEGIVFRVTKQAA